MATTKRKVRCQHFGVSVRNSLLATPLHSHKTGRKVSNDVLSDQNHGPDGKATPASRIEALSWSEY